MVREYQEEYFSRVALIMDTYVPPKFGPAHRLAFEGGVSVVASVADWFSRSEAVVDVLAAGPDPASAPFAGRRRNAEVNRGKTQSTARLTTFMKDITESMAQVDPQMIEAGGSARNVIATSDATWTASIRALRSRAPAIPCLSRAVRSQRNALGWRTEARV